MDESALKDPWHYPRPKLAEKYLKVFDIGLIAAQGLFAKRRMGKSEFLEKDLLPAAHEHGYLWAALGKTFCNANRRDGRGQSPLC